MRSNFKVTLFCFISFVLTCRVGEKYYYGVGYYAPCWSPDGKRIYYFKNVVIEKRYICGEAYCYKYVKNEWYICSCDMNGEDEKVIAFIGAGGGVSTIDVVPSGEIIYSRYYSGYSEVDTIGPFGIIKIDKNGNRKVLLAWGENPRYCYNYTKIVFDSGGIWIMNKDGTGLKKLVKDGKQPVMDSNNKFIVFTKRKHGYNHIWIYFVDNEEENSLFSYAEYPEVFPNGEEIICSGGVIFNLQSRTYDYIEGFPYFSKPRVNFINQIVFQDINSIIKINKDGTSVKIIKEGISKHE